MSFHKEKKKKHNVHIKKKTNNNSIFPNDKRIFFQIEANNTTQHRVSLTKTYKIQKLYFVCLKWPIHVYWMERR